MNSLEPALHRPRTCPGCQHLSTAIVDGKCLTCRGTPAPPPAYRPPCEGCSQPLFIYWPGRTHCRRCRPGAA